MWNWHHFSGVQRGWRLALVGKSCWHSGLRANCSVSSGNGRNRIDSISEAWGLFCHDYYHEITESYFFTAKVCAKYLASFKLKSFASHSVNFKKLVSNGTSWQLQRSNVHRRKIFDSCRSLWVGACNSTVFLSQCFYSPDLFLDRILRE